MPIEIIVPRLGWSMEEGAFVAWLKKDGEFVRAGEPLFSIEGDKAIQEIESIDSGVLRIAEDCPKPGSAVRVGDLLGYLLAEGEAFLPKERGTICSAKDAPTRNESLAVPVGGSPTGTDESPVPPGKVPAISPRALRKAAELGVDWSKLAGSGRTGRIRERDVLAAEHNGPFRRRTSQRRRSDESSQSVAELV